MSTVLHPVGPQRARVYWVRRLLVALVVVALAVLATTAVSWLRGDAGETAAASASSGSNGNGAPSGEDATAASAAGSEKDSGAAEDDDDAADATSDDETAADEATGDAATDDAATQEASASAPVECAPQALQLTLTAAAVQFPAGAEPVLTATVTNVGDDPCTVDAGDGSREVVITSGDDRVWSTKDCATESEASRQLLLGAGAADTVPIEWARVRSAEGCPAGLPAPEPGTYQAVAHLGELSSQTVVFVLK